jgi:uncharacterized phage protein (TIGR01671 family)
MRDLMFRAWDKKKKKWIDGAYGFHILGEMMLIGGLFQDYSIENLNDIIIEQFTGIKDKNGTEIYEGDRIKQAGHIIGGTKKEEGNIERAYNGRCFVRLMWESGMECHADITEDAEIIGNIHQPELIGDKDEHN